MSWDFCTLIYVLWNHAGCNTRDVILISKLQSWPATVCFRISQATSQWYRAIVCSHAHSYYHLLNTGSIFASFQVVPASTDAWKISMRYGATSSATSFRNHGGTSSGPYASPFRFFFDCFKTPSFWYDQRRNVRKKVALLGIQPGVLLCRRSS